MLLDDLSWSKSFYILLAAQNFFALLDHLSLSKSLHIACCSGYLCTFFRNLNISYLTQSTNKLLRPSFLLSLLLVVFLMLYICSTSVITMIVSIITIILLSLIGECSYLLIVQSCILYFQQRCRDAAKLFT